MGYSHMRRRLLGRVPKSKITWHGFSLVRLAEYGVTREAIRFWRDGSLVAVIQKNGNIGVSGTGIFDKPDNPRAQYRAARCLHGLKMVGPEFVEAHKKRDEAAQHKLDLEFHEAEADRLGLSNQRRAAVAELRRNFNQLRHQGMSEGRHAEMLGYLAALDPDGKPKGD